MPAHKVTESSPRLRRRVLLTDHPWPGIEVERSIIEAAGLDFIAGPSETGSAAEIEALIAAHDPAGIMTCWAQISEKAVALPSQLRVVTRMGVGLDNIAIDAATKRGAWVTNIPDYCVPETSDHGVALLLNAWRGVAQFDRDVKAGHWRPATARNRRLAEATVGVIGYGRIGSEMARKLARGFGCRVLVTSPSLVRAGPPGRELEPHIFVSGLAQIQQEADAITLHLPMRPETRHLVNLEFLAACRRRPLIVNVSRGALIDNAALVQALDRGLVSGAALDVIEGEPQPPASLIQRPDVTVTPHIAFSSATSIAELCRRAADEVVRVLRGEAPLHSCNQPLL